MPSVIKTRFKGVHWAVNAKKWIAQLKVKRKAYHLGVYNDDRIAAVIYILANAMLNGELKYYGENMGQAELKGNPPVWHIGQLGPIPQILVDLATDKINQTHNITLSKEDEVNLAKIFPPTIPKTKVDVNVAQELYRIQINRAKQRLPPPTVAASSSATPSTTPSIETKEEPMIFSSIGMADYSGMRKRAKMDDSDKSLFELAAELEFEDTEDEFKLQLGFIDDPSGPFRTLEFEGIVNDVSSSSAAASIEKYFLKITALDPTLYIATMQYKGANYFLGFHQSGELDDYFHNLAVMLINRLHGNTTGLQPKDLNTVNFLIASANNGDALWNSTRDIALYLQSDLVSQSDKATVAQQAIEIFKHYKQAGHHRHLM